MKKLTIVVPAYNVQDYLENNIKSICEPEEPEGLEVIVVDDGSTDKTPEIADSLAIEYSDTVRVIHKNNGGHGSGINTGIANASGKYFKVVDADDWVDHKALLNLLDFIDRVDRRCDLLINPFYRRIEDVNKASNDFKRINMPNPLPDNIEYKKIYAFEEIAKAPTVYMMHNVTFRTDILREHDILIDEKCFFVDCEYVFYPIPYIKTIAFLPDFLYQYRIGRPGQSVDPNKSVRNESNYRQVLNSLFKYYKRLPNDVNSSVKLYLERLLAGIYAGYVKTLLLLPNANKRKNYFKAVEGKIKIRYPGVYFNNSNKAISLLRSTNYVTYPLAVLAARIMYR